MMGGGNKVLAVILLLLIVATVGVALPQCTAPAHAQEPVTLTAPASPVSPLSLPDGANPAAVTVARAEDDGDNSMVYAGLGIFLAIVAIGMLVYSAVNYRRPGR